MPGEPGQLALTSVVERPNAAAQFSLASVQGTALFCLKAKKHKMNSNKSRKPLRTKEKQ